MRYIIQDKFGFRKRIQFSQKILLRKKDGWRLSRFYSVWIDKILPALFLWSFSLFVNDKHNLLEVEKVTLNEY
jgi:hypothetical protein